MCHPNRNLDPLTRSNLMWDTLQFLKSFQPREIFFYKIILPCFCLKDHGFWEKKKFHLAILSGLKNLYSSKSPESVPYSCIIQALIKKIDGQENSCRSFKTCIFKKKTSLSKELITRCKLQFSNPNILEASLCRKHLIFKF